MTNDYTRFTMQEMMAVAAAREIEDGEKVIIGTGLPLLGAFLAQKTHAPNMIAIYESGGIDCKPIATPLSVADSVLVPGSAMQGGLMEGLGIVHAGELDLGFLGGAQIDKYGNINSTGAGDWSKKESFTYFAGSGGANDMATSGKRTVAIMPQDKKKFVEKCEYITTPGYLGGPGEREKLGMIGGGPNCVISTMGVYRFDEDTKEMYLAEFFPGQSVEKVKAACAWDLKVSPNVVETTQPTEKDIKILRDLDPTGFYLG